MEPLLRDEVSGMMDRVEELLAHRERRHPEPLMHARDVLLSMEESGHRLVCTRLSEVFFWLGEYAESDGDKERYHGLGVSYGEKAVLSDGDNVAAHLWYAANMGSHGLVRGIARSLLYLKPFQRHAEKAIELDESYFFGAPLRLMGRFLHKCPGWPVGPGDVKQAIVYLERAMDGWPEFLLNALYLAEALRDRRHRLRAREVLRHIVDRADLKPFPIYQAMIQQRAQKLLDQDF